MSTPETAALARQRDLPLDQRQLILEAAVAILGAGGSGALTVRRVAQAAGCSTTGVYTYFGGKNGLVEALFIQGFERFDAAQAAVEQTASAPVLDRLLARAESYRTWALAQPTLYLLMFAASVPDFEPSEAALERSLRSFTDLVEVVDAACREGTVAGPAETVAYHLWATIHGYVMLELTGRHLCLPGDISEHYRQGLALVLSGVRR